MKFQDVLIVAGAVLAALVINRLTGLDRMLDQMTAAA